MVQKPIWKLLEERTSLHLWIPHLPDNVRRLLFVADQAIGPDVGAGDLKQVLTGLNCIGNIDTPGSGPHHAETLSIDGYFGQMLYRSQVQVDSVSFRDGANL